MWMSWATGVIVGFVVFFFNCHNGFILKQGITRLALCSGMKVREKVELSEKCKFYKDLRQCVSPVGDALQSENHEFLKIMPRIQPPSSVLINCVEMKDSFGFHEARICEMLPCASWPVTSERRGVFAVKAQDPQLWDFLVLLETSLRDCREDFSPCPSWEIDFCCLFHVDADCLLLCCHTVPELEPGRTKALQPHWAWYYWGLFAWFLSEVYVCSLLFCCCSLRVRTETVEVVYHEDKLPQNFFCRCSSYHRVSEMVHIRIGCHWLWLLSVTLGSSPHLCLGLVLVAGTWGFIQKAVACGGEGSWWDYGSPGFLLKVERRTKRLCTHISKVCRGTSLSVVWALQLHCSVPTCLQELTLSMLLVCLKCERRCMS